MKIMSGRLMFPDDGTGGATLPEWMNTIPEEIRGEASLRQHKDVGSLAKSYVNAQRLIGADKVAVPQKNWGETQWADFYERIGRPKTADQYTDGPKDFKFEEGVSIDPERLKTTKALFHKLGLTPSQAEGVLAHYYENVNNTVKGERESRQAASAKGMEALKAEWGEKLNANIDLAKAAVKNLGGEDLLKYLDESGLGNDPRLIKAFSKIGTMMLEDKSGGGAPLQINDTTAAAAEIQKLSGDEEFQRALGSRDHPGHQAAVSRWQALFATAYPGTQS